MSGPVVQLPLALVGQLVDQRYRVKRFVASGGFGWVYVVEQELLGERIRTLALKLLKSPGMQRGQVREMFADALAIAKLVDTHASHPDLQHVVQVFDIGCCTEWDDRGYIVLEFVDHSLADEVVRDVGIPYPMALDYARKLARGLALAHDLPRPVLHRDLKTGNALVTSNGVPKLSDFGEAAEISRVIGHAPSAGTIACQAPESLEGVCTTRSDVFSFGVMLYEMFTGRHPFHELLGPEVAKLEQSEQIRRHRKRRAEPVDDVAAVNPLLRDHPELGNVVMRCLSEDPDLRYRDARELADALANVEAGHAASAATPTSTSPGFLLGQANAAHGRGDRQVARDFLDRLFRAGSEASDHDVLGRAWYLAAQLHLEDQEFDEAYRATFRAERLGVHAARMLRTQISRAQRKESGSHG